MLAIEADGYRFHSTAWDWRRERARQNALIRLGWTVYRITWDDVVTGERRVIEDIRLILARNIERTVRAPASREA